MSAKVVMYSTAVCPYCVRAEQLLRQRGVEAVSAGESIEVGGLDAEPLGVVLAERAQRVFEAHLAAMVGEPAQQTLAQRVGHIQAAGEEPGSGGGRFHSCRVFARKILNFL
jgi:hypothetical protein